MPLNQITLTAPYILCMFAFDFDSSSENGLKDYIFLSALV